MLGFLRIILPLLTVFLFPALLLAQENKTISHAYLKPQAKIVLLNPGFEWEIPHSFRNSINTHIGIGYGGSYPELTTRYETGLQALIAPFSMCNTVLISI